ncbi:class I SAM-dependent methyltransferase [Cytophagales bacterium LB-30]|uniref:Class I SAM-dependent methyltransferase n=1 Tax=Shiella aurantiaca TaxID=3058365 RepID=A0ABT8F6J3_9BACT|nr:class I SAM-dependent methyltransferase [Shiella aurantiaca]MDN4165591.1 class I SAM-dependent methyltransferase [Shiella aurantiaca]
MYQKIEACPSCDSKEQTLFKICKDYTVSGETFAIVECKNCGFKFTNPRPDEQSIGKYYESEEYISHTDKAQGFIQQVYKLVRGITLYRKYRLISKLVAKGKILDIGCGTGDFLTQFKDRNWEVRGVEKSTKSRAIAIEKNGNIISEDLSQIEDQGYDVITLWHVLEHIHTLNETLTRIRKLVKKDGYIVIAVPNEASFDAKHYGEHWAAYDVPRHLYHFNQKTLKEIAKKNKLKVKKILPMKWDSFYVSMLSEKNKGNTNPFLKGLFMGLRSNTWARNHNNNYSSVLYILNK